MLRAVRESGNVRKVVYTSSFFALGPTDGCVADESQVCDCSLSHSSSSLLRCDWILANQFR